MITLKQKLVDETVEQSQTLFWYIKELSLFMNKIKDNYSVQNSKNCQASNFNKNNRLLSCFVHLHYSFLINNYKILFPYSKTFLDLLKIRIDTELSDFTNSVSLLLPFC